MAEVRRVTIQEAIKYLDAKYADDHEFADAMVANLEAGYVTAGLGDDGNLHFQITPAGEEHARSLIRKLAGDEE